MWLRTLSCGAFAGTFGSIGAKSLSLLYQFKGNESFMVGIAWRVFRNKSQPNEGRSCATVAHVTSPVESLQVRPAWHSEIVIRTRATQEPRGVLGQGLPAPKLSSEFSRFYRMSAKGPQPVLSPLVCCLCRLWRAAHSSQGLKSFQIQRTTFLRNSVSETPSSRIKTVLIQDGLP